MRQQLQALLGALPAGVHEQTLEGFELLLIKGEWGELALAYQGAQVLHYRPAGESPLLWLSDCLKAPPAPIRGGVPLCWPWFGPHPSEPDHQPAHGVARTARWHWSVVASDAGGIQLSARPAGPLWPGLESELSVRVGDRALALGLESHNTGDTVVELTQALHSYLSVGEVGGIEIHGLGDCDYRDKLRDGAADHQQGTVSISGEVDRVYRHTGVIEVRDPVMRRCLRIAKSGSGSTVVWNPGDSAARMSDVGSRQQPGFVCVEAANTLLDPVRLAPGERRQIGTVLSLTSYDRGGAAAT